MKDEIAISVENISKLFKIYSKPSDMFTEMMSGKQRFKPFWALRDISFNVLRGQVVGILGRNGAGKSTLLKIITGTLDKTEGNLQVNGRVSSILELGTGFSSDFTGRENIYIGGLMMGLSHEEITKKINWIIEFSELEDFIDQPFKTYSTGMQARLTFSTAVCINPDILIIDEALSVGDARFQRKSFSKINEFRNAGHTILLVSHDINTINTMCDHAILLENGKIFEQGQPHHISQVYYKLLFSNDPEPQKVSPVSEQANKWSEIEYQLKTENIQAEKGKAWQVVLENLEVPGDNAANPRQSELILYENDLPLGPAHSLHETIRLTGFGVYSHWNNGLIFSSSDNSDPRTNGRIYTLKSHDVIQKSTAAFEVTLSNVQPNKEREDIRTQALHKLGLKDAYHQDNSHLMRMGNGKAEILDYGILAEDDQKVSMLTSGKEYILFFRIIYYEDIEGANVGFLIRNIKGIEMFGATTGSLGIKPASRKQGEVIDVRLKVTMWLTNGIYFLTINSADPFSEKNHQFDSLYDGYQFEVARNEKLLHSSIVDLDPTLEIRTI